MCLKIKIIIYIIYYKKLKRKVCRFYKHTLTSKKILKQNNGSDRMDQILLRI